MNDPGTVDRRSVLRQLGATALVTAGGAEISLATEIRGLFDAHAHVLVNDPLRYPLNSAAPAGIASTLAAGPGAEQLIELMNVSGVEQAALVQHGPVFGDDNAYIADAARNQPRRMLAIGGITATAPDALEKLNYWVRERGLTGFRVGGSGDNWPEAASTLRFWEAAANLKAHIVLLLGGADKGALLDSLERVMRQLPKLSVALDHLMDYGRATTPQVLDPAILAAAAIPGLYMKFTTANLVRLVQNGGSARAAIKRVVDAYGASRVMWGSDVGNTRVPYANMVSMARDAVADLSASEQAMVLGGAARVLYGRN